MVDDAYARTTPAAEQPELAEGTILVERYTIERLIGRGGMGAVYRAHDLELDRSIAVKVLRSAPTAAAVERFRREVRLTGRITHANVIRVFDLGAAPGLRFLTMELVDGCSLRTRLAAGKVTVAESAEIARQTALGLAAAHEVGVVHRDLKPENILLARGGRVVVADFGVAGEPAEGGAASGIVGTSAYMAPEQANGQAATAQTDLYALGLVIAEMLTGEVPLVGVGPIATALRREREEPPSLSSLRAEVPAELDQLTGSLLQVDPKRRPASTAEVAKALSVWARPLSDATYLTGSATDATIDLPSPSPPSRSTAKRAPAASSTSAVLPVGGVTRRRFLTIGAVGVAAAGTGAAALVWRARRPGAGGVAAVDPARPILFAIEPTGELSLPPALAFLAPAVPSAAFRALAAILPGRVDPPGGRGEPAAARDRGAIPVGVALRASPGGFTAAYRGAGRVATAEQPSPGAALDAAARAFVDAHLPRGAAPTDEDRRDQERWGASGTDAVIAFRRAELALARMRVREADLLLTQLETGRFVRPFIPHIAYLFELTRPHDELLARARAAAPAAPPGERDLLLAAIAAYESDPHPAFALPPLPLGADTWHTIVMAWAQAMAERTDEAFALVEALAADPELGPVGLYTAARMAHYWDRRRTIPTVTALAEALPEEVVPQLMLAAAREGADDVDGAEEALARAVALGAEADARRVDCEALIALARFDLERAVQRGRSLLLLGEVDPTARLNGEATLFAVHILRGASYLASGRAESLVAALRAEGTIFGVRYALNLGTDCFLRGDDPFARRLWALADELSLGLDGDYLVTARVRLAALDRLEGRFDDRGFEAALAAQIDFLRAAGLALSDERATAWTSQSRLLVALRAGDCRAVSRATAARLDDGDPLFVLSSGRCQLDAGDHAGLLARLTGNFPTGLRRLLPTLVMRRELLLGRTLLALARPAEARVHLSRVVDLWRLLPASAEVAEADRLLRGI